MPARRRRKDEEQQDLKAILAGLSPGGDWIVKIYRYAHRNTTQNPDWLADRPPKDVSEAMIASEFGPGKYFCRPWSETDQQWAPGKTVNIADEAEGVALPPMITTGDNGAAIQVQMMQMQMQLQQQSSERQFQMMQGFNQNMLSIMTALIQNSRGPDLASIVSIVKDMSGPGLGGAITTIKDVFALTKEMSDGGGNGEQDTTKTILNMVVPRLMDKLDGKAAIPANVSGAASFPRNPPAVSAVEHSSGDSPEAQNGPVPVHAAITPEQQQNAARRAFLDRLKAKARTGKDTEFWADYIDENQDEEPCYWILHAVRQYPFNVMWPELLKADPELQEPVFEPWFHRLYDALRGETETK